MIERSGLYQVTVNEKNNPTYLSTGLYHVEVKGKNKDVRFTSASGSSTYERLAMLNIFEKQSRVVCTPFIEQRIVPFWYRGSLEIDPSQGNGLNKENV